MWNLQQWGSNEVETQAKYYPVHNTSKRHVSAAPELLKIPTG